jgi:hypothetical protein
MKAPTSGGGIAGKYAIFDTIYLFDRNGILLLNRTG